MHWLLVDGVRVPRRIGAHPALDFCNTWAGWGEPPTPGSEWLSANEVLAVWANYAELISERDAMRLRRSAQRRPDDAARILAAARRLRTALHTAVMEPETGAGLRTVTDWSRRTVGHLSLRPTADGPVRWEFLPGTGLELPVFAVARAAQQTC